ncbi:MAG: hypothetical protein U9R08_07220 [Nanoarchaeota archaeon]|nr:hypothetical protein [Nanoarchaeota archaeon]
MKWMFVFLFIILAIGCKPSYDITPEVNIDKVVLLDGEVITSEISRVSQNVDLDSCETRSCIDNVALQLAMSNYDISYCEMISSDFMKLDDCKTTVIMRKVENTNDTEFCNELQGELRGVCLGE